MALKYLTALTLLLITHHLSLSAETIHSQTNGILNIDKDHRHDKIRMVRGKHGPLPLHDNSQRPLHEKVANQFAPEFGLRNPADQLVMKHTRTHHGKTHIRYQQMHLGLPVIGGELIANLNTTGEVSSISGEVSPTQIRNIIPSISADEASNIAITAVSKWHRIEYSRLTASLPELSIYDDSLLQSTTSSSILVWKVEVSPTFLAPLNEYLLIDARYGGIVLHFNQIESVLNRETYTADNTTTLPGTLVCDETEPTCVSGDQDAIDAHTNAANVYDFYFQNHGRDSIDGMGMTIVSTTHYGGAAGSGAPFQNAFWTDTLEQMVYGDNFASADDVVAHEMTHGVTSFESDLFYYSESGSINESLSDVWGELIDLSNNIGPDLPSQRWLIGEDLPVGAIRSMSDPTASPYNDPDRMTSGLFYTGPGNAGDVHRNSTVNSKAAYLMVDGTADEPGGAFNGQLITPLGIPKVADIYYEVQTNLLTSGADYLDLYNALIQGCDNLIGTGGIISNDCDQVQLAVDAVEMNLAPNASYAPSAEICPVGINVYDIFFDDFEGNNTSNWSVENADGSSNVWQTGNINLSANNGNYTLLATGYSSTSFPGRINDSRLAYSNPIRVPTSTPTYIHFDQAFYFESANDMDSILRFYDGGLLEYTIDNGNSWIDANSLIQDGRNYTGSITSTDPLLDNKNAYIALSNGYNQSQLNLSSLAGNYVRFRFRSIADEFAASGAWSIDNFRVYMCTDNAPPVPDAGPDQTARADQLIQLAGSATDADGDTITYSWTQTAGPTVVLSDTSIPTPSFTAPRGDSNLQFTMSVTDSNGQTESDSTIVAINLLLSGTGSTGNGCSISQNGRFDPVWILLLSFFALLHWRRKIWIKIKFNNQN